ncbi:hypothetical protein ASG49_14135 [Marmoricola sp. Leaf446]|uniref:M15 family metallopeptidase n=1 Tax=Marmoricola sp. Leaf446 TaxID=1736379 RepID=UPI0006F4CD39|nr:M15 family metallopeptidase [Marmoricola sp. Leaf446]KQT90863.1 hypothetical protein ASG49_14135 [Marmoricola sp. Leaf446]
MCEEHQSGAGVGRRPLLAMLGLGAVTTACGSSAGDDQRRASAPTTPDAAGGDGGGSGKDAAPVAEPDMAVDPPGKLTGALRSSDFLVYGEGPLEKGAVEKMLDIEGVQQVEPIALASFYVDDTQVTCAAVDPATFRRFTMAGTAQTPEVWNRVAGGEIAVEPKIGRKLQSKDGYLEIGNDSDSKRIHVGAYAGLLPETVARRIDAVVNVRWGEELGMKLGNAALVGLGSTSPQKVRKKLQAAAGDGASILILGPNFDIDAKQTVVLSGGSVAQAVGSFSYRANPDGSVAPDPGWVSANIRSMQMPIIGDVTGHRVMLPQLKGALEEVVTQGLSSKIYTYDGCYVPRFIGRDPSRGLSFHTYGTAIDLNAADNYRGIAGAMDRQVVAIFKRWGFAWGGDWNYTDPMHFELAKLRKA